MPPTLRFTNIADAQEQLAISNPSPAKVDVLTSKLAASERFVERYCRRRFAPEPSLANPTTGYQRRLLAVSSVSAQQGPVASGLLALTFNGHSTPFLQLPLDAPTLQAAMQALVSVGVGNMTCTGGPLPSWPISMTFAGALAGAQPAITVDNSQLGANAWAIVDDGGFDSAPPVLKRFSTRGSTTIRIPDLRLVEATPDPRVPNVAGVALAGRRLLPNQYDLGYNAYALGGADEAIGSSSAEPATSITLGYGPSSGLGLAGSFAFVQPLGYQANDLQIVGRWGWNPIPDDIYDAVYVAAARLYNERNAMFSDQMITGEGIVYQFFKQLPASTQMALDSYRVPNVALV